MTQFNFWLEVDSSPEASSLVFAVNPFPRSVGFSPAYATVGCAPLGSNAAELWRTGLRGS